MRIFSEIPPKLPNPIGHNSPSNFSKFQAIQYHSFNNHKLSNPFRKVYISLKRGWKSSACFNKCHTSSPLLGACLKVGIWRKCDRWLHLRLITFLSGHSHVAVCHRHWWLSLLRHLPSAASLFFLVLLFWKSVPILNSFGEENILSVVEKIICVLA